MSSAHIHSEPIAVVGIACRFPGASSISELGDLLVDPTDLSQSIPEERFSIDGFYNENAQHHGNTNVRKSYFLKENVREFDNSFFNITTMEASAMDPQQRLLLETTYEALENASIAVSHLKGSDTAVYVGLMCGDYENELMRDLDSAPRYQATGVGRSIMANRISYTWDLRGPSMTIDTACSSSLVALHQATQALRLRESQLAIVGGSNLLLGPEWYITESNLNMLSPRGVSRMWDAGADGYARGDGVAAVVLKRLSDAIADGDFIECVVRETGVCQDGRTNGITTPSAESQASLIRRVYAKAGLDPVKDGCQYFEAHGTGTPAGDPVEAEAISSVFGGAASDKVSARPLYVGSIKTVIGHTEGTAGLAGLIKATLALQEQKIFPNKHFDRLNHKIEPFYRGLMVPTTALPWPMPLDGQPRRASVNSFGFGGTNSHAIVESFDNKSYMPIRQESEPQVFTPFTLSAKSETSLYGGLKDFSRWLDRHPDLSLRDLVTSVYRRSPYVYRASISAATPAELSFRISEKIKERQSVTPARGSPKILGIFTGQGAQSPGMMAEILQTSSWAQSKARKLEETLNTLVPAQDRPPQALVDQLLVCRSEAEASATMKAALSQPLCTLVQILLVDILHEAGVHFDTVVGHSSGEIAAAYAAGRLSAESALAAAYYRGLHTRLAGGAVSQPGAMLAVSMSYQDAHQFCTQPRFRGRLCVATSNSPSSATLSGDQDAIVEAEEDLKSGFFKSKRLSVDKAYHSHHMHPCSTAYLASLRSLPGFTSSPEMTTRWFSSVHVQEAGDIKLSMDYWDENMVRPVLFSQALEKACHDGGPFDLIVELGPHPALKGPVLQTLQNIWPNNDTPYAALLRRGDDSVQTLRQGLGQLWEAGLEPDLAAVDKLLSGIAGRTLQRLPTYHWDHNKEHWHESRHSKAFQKRKKPTHPLLGNLLPDSTSLDMRWRNILLESELPWLAGHKIQNQMVFPAAGYLCMAIEAARDIILPGESIKTIEISDLDIGQALLIPHDGLGVETICTMTEICRNVTGRIGAIFSLYSAIGDNLSLMAKGAVELRFGPSADDLLLYGHEDSHTNLLMKAIDSERLYTAWSALGYGYTGCFHAIKDASRRLSAAQGSISSTTGDKLLLHPATLDAAIQTILLAYCHPEDGRISTMQVPKRIRKFRVNAGLAMSINQRPQSLPFVASIPDRERAGLCGDMDLFTPTGEGLLQIEALQCTPLSPATAENDLKLFYSTAWAPASPNAPAVCWDGLATEADFNLAEDLERLSFYYMTRLEKAIPKSHPQRHDATWKHYFGFLAHVRGLVESGVHPYIKKEWLQDTSEVAEAIRARHPESLDRKVIEAVGENVAQTVRSGSTMLEHLLRDGLLDDYYTHGMTNKSYIRYLARMVAQLAHRYPAMNVLEIGNATKTIFEEIGHTFGTYTFTDVSIGFFEKARDVFADHADKMNFMKLDAERDVVEQGFEAHSYDVVVASLVLHATSNLERTLCNARRLLKPGGYLIMLEITDNDPVRLGFVFGTLPQWWIGHSEGRTLSPCVGPMAWDTFLQRSGFSQIDSITPDLDRLPFPLSVISAQATDDAVRLLRSPFANPTVFPKLVVVGGATTATVRLVSSLCEKLQTRYREVCCIQKLEDYRKEHHSCSTVLSLADLDKPVLENVSDGSLKALKDLLMASSTVLWITNNAKDECPGANMTMGFFRTVLWEIPDLRLRSIDFVDGSVPDACVISTALLEFETATQLNRGGMANSLLWSSERELIYRHGRLEIPRLISNNGLNDGYNAGRRSIVRKNGNAPLRLSSSGWLEQGASFPSRRNTNPSHSDLVKIEVEYSTAFPVPVRGRRAGFSQAYVVFGKTASSNRSVLALTTDCASAVSPSFCSILQVADDCNPPLLLTQIVCILQANYLLDSVAEDNHLLIHNPGKRLASAITEDRGIRVTMTSTSQQDGTVYLHHSLPERTLRAKIGRNIDYFADLSLPGLGEDLVSASIRACLSPTTSIIDTRPILGLMGKPPGATIDSGGFMALNHTVSLSEQLTEAYQLAHHISTPPFDVLPLSSFGDEPVKLDRKIVQWSNVRDAMVRIVPTYLRVKLRPDRTYWLVGLTGSLGLSLCEWLIHKGASHLVLSSRHPQVDPDWIKEMYHERGTTITVLPCDAADKTSLATAYQEIKNTLPPLAGVAQGAMVLDDASVMDMNTEKMARVAGPKVNGSVNLDQLLVENDEEIDFFVLFSSIAAVFGSHGQSNYTAANSFVRSLALRRRKQGNPASVLNLGLVVGVGYASDKLNQSQRETLRKNGFRWISEDDFHHAFAEAILASPCFSNMDHEITIGADRFPVDSPSKPLWADDPRLSHMITHDTVGTHMDKGDDSDSQQTPRERLASATNAAEAKLAIKDSFLGKLQSILRLSPAQMEKESALLSSGTDQLGFDSLIAVEVRSWFLKALGISISTLEILGGATIAGIIELALSKVNHIVKPSLAADSESTSIQISVSGSSFTSASTSMSMSSPTSDSSRSTVHTEAGEDSVAQKTRSATPTTSDDEISEHGIERHPLSFGQEMFWFVHTLMSDPTTLNNTVAYRLTGPLDVNKLEKAVRVVSERQGALRTAIQQSEAGLAFQSVLNYPLLRLEKVSASRHEVSPIIENLAGYTYRLNKGESMRIIVVSSSPTEHHLLLGFHHINMDGISLQVVLAELEAAYSGEPLSESPLQYVDYTRRQRQFSEAGEWSEMLRFWQAELSDFSGELPIMQLPDAAKARRPLTKYRTTEVESRVEPSVMALIAERCRELRMTQFCFYLTVFRVLLARLANVDDFCVGIADGNRLSDDALDAVGMYLNLLPLRFRSTQNMSFFDVARDTRQKTQAGIAHSAIPFGLLLSKLGVPRSADCSPVFQAFVDYRQGAKENQPFGDCVLDVCYYQGAKAAYDVSLDIIDSKEAPTFIRLAVQDSLYSKADAQLFIDCFMQLLTSFAEPNSQEHRINSVAMFGAKSVKGGLSFIKGQIKSSSWPVTLAQRVEEISATHAGNMAIIDGDGTVLTYMEMSDRVVAIADNILKLGVPRGSVIGIYQEPAAGWVCSLLAIWRAGCVYLPLDPATPMSRLQSNVAHCAPSLIVVDGTSKDAAATFKTLLLEVTSCRRVSQSLNFASRLPEIKATDPAAVLYTSGSTGNPKGIILSHRNLVHELEFSSQSYDFGVERVLCQSALTFDMSLTQIFTALAYGGSLHIVPRAQRGDAISIVKMIVEHDITFTGATPSEYLSWTNFGGGDLGQSHWRHAICGGEQIAPALLHAFSSIGKPQLKLFNAYGPTETTCSATRWELPYRELAADPARSRIPAGRAAPNCSVYIVDQDLTLLPVGMPGEVLIGGAKVAAGYLGNSPQTQEKFLEYKYVPGELVARGWTSVHRTGDVGRILPDGQLVIEGRIAGDTQVKLRGNRVDLVDVQDAIVRAGKGRLVEVVVCLLNGAQENNDNEVSDTLVALVVFEASFPQDARDTFLSGVLERAPLPRASKPTMIRAVKQLPRSVSGKVDRKALTASLRAHFDPVTSSHRENENWSEMELRLRNIWLQVLPTEVDALICRSSDFFHVGGNSLLLVVLQKKIRDVFGSSFPLVTLFDSSTLDKMALLVDEKSVKEDRIDWEMETDPERCIGRALFHSTAKSLEKRETSATVVLTGATGLLGKALLRALASDERISTIHCISVRRIEALEPFLTSGKVRVHEGDLNLPRLGLSAGAAHCIFSDADVIIHNAADVSHMKSYHSIKSANFGSTTELVRLALSLGRLVPFHFVSTAGVSLYTGLETFHEISAAPFPPPTDKPDGYTASKWASERFLERVSERTGLPVWVHRPSNIHRTEDPQFDLFQNLLKYSRILQAVPIFPSLQGHLNLVEAVDVAHTLIGDVFGCCDSRVIYRHQIGSRNLSMDEMGDFIRKDPVSEVRVLDVEDWTAAAEEEGLPEAVSEWFKKVAHGVPVKYPLLVPGEESDPL